MTEDIFVRFARKYFEEAKNDLERARRALGYNDYPQAVFYAQQALEKSVKAMLEVKHRIVHNHEPELIAVFYDIFGNEWKEEYNDIVRALEFLQEYYTRARYPLPLPRGSSWTFRYHLTRNSCKRCKICRKDN